MPRTKNEDTMKENVPAQVPKTESDDVPTVSDKPPVGAPANVPKTVDIFIPRAGVNEEQTLTVGINGVMYTLPRGKTSTVPKCVADEIKRSWEATSYMDEHSNDMQDQTIQMARSLGLMK